MSNKDLDKVFEKQEEYEKARELAKKNKKTKNKKKKVGIVAVVVAISLALSGVGVAIAKLLNKNNDKDNSKNKPKDSIETTVPELEEDLLADLGIELEFPKKGERKEYQNPTGNVNKDEIVEDENGTIWADSEAAEKADQVGKEEFDDKGGTLETDSDGKAHEKQDGYEIKDPEGNTVSTGDLNENGVPDGYVWDDIRGEYVRAEDAGKYIYSEYDFYNESGDLIISKGTLMSIERYNEAKKDLYTTRPETTTQTPETTTPSPETTVPETTTPSQETTAPETTAPETTAPTPDSYGGITNPDGTYTIYGTTYMDKATFEAICLSEEIPECVVVNGVYYLKSYYDEMMAENSLTK